MERIEKPKCIDLFSGAGGFTLGFAMAGWNVVGYVEYWEPALKTYELNAPNYGFGNSELIGRDITKITDEQVLAFKKKHGHIHMIIGGPPCQSFSLSGKRGIGDPRDNLFLHFVRFVNLIKPDLFLVENVPGMLSKKNEKGELMIDVIRQAFQMIGYENEYALLNAANYGVPQFRRRVFIMGSTKKEVGFPLPTNFGDKEGEKDTSGDYAKHQYKTCSVCERRYASYVFNEHKEALCLFCWHHQNDARRGRLKPSPNLEVGWLVIPKKIPVPAKPDQMFRVSCIERRSNLFGVSSFLYTWDVEGNVIWQKGSDVRRVADNDEECDSAHQWIYRNQVINPMVQAMEEVA